MADGNKNSRDRQGGLLMSNHIIDLKSLYIILAFNGIHGTIEDKTDFGFCPGFINENGGSPELVTPVNDINLAGEFGKMNSFRNSGIAPTYNRYGLSLKKAASQVAQ